MEPETKTVWLHERSLDYKVGDILWHQKAEWIVMSVWPKVKMVIAKQI